MRPIALAALLSAAACVHPAEMPDRWKDVEPTQEETGAGDGCELASRNLSTLDGGKPCSFWRPDYVTYCRAQMAYGVPMCPIKKARAKTCEEAHEVCR